MRSGWHWAHDSPTWCGRVRRHCGDSSSCSDCLERPFSGGLHRHPHVKQRYPDFCLILGSWDTLSNLMLCQWALGCFYSLPSWPVVIDSVSSSWISEALTLTGLSVPQTLIQLSLEASFTDPSPRVRSLYECLFSHTKIAKIRNIFTQRDAKKRVQVFVTSRLDYCKGCYRLSSILSGWADSTIPIQKTTLLSEWFPCGISKSKTGSLVFSYQALMLSDQLLSRYRRLTPPPNLEFCSYSDMQSH